MISPYLRIGLIARPHGVRGNVMINPATDDPARFKGLTQCYLELHGKHIPVRLSVVSAGEDMVLAHIEGYDTPEAAEKLRGTYLCVDRAHTVELPAYTYFVVDLIGLEVSDTEGKAYGKLTNVYETGANDVYEVAGGKLMVPALKKVLHEVDIPGGRMVLEANVLREVGLFAD